jgi:hypothetical protein
MFKAIKFTAIFIYHFLFIDQTTGQQSNTKFFANVGYIIWCALFPYVIVKGIASPMDLWLVFGAVVIGNRTLNVLMQNKYGNAQNPNQTWSAGIMTNTPATSQPGPLTTSSSVTTATDPPGQDTFVNVVTTTATTAQPGVGPPRVPDLSGISPAVNPVSSQVSQKPIINTPATTIAPKVPDVSDLINE